MLGLAGFVSSVALFSNICGLLRLPIWTAGGFGVAVLALFGKSLRAHVVSQPRDVAVSSDSWDFAEIISFLGFGLLAWRHRTGSWSFSLPSSKSVDLVHHLALTDFLSRTGQIPRGSVEYLGPMVGYPPGAHVFVALFSRVSHVHIFSALTFIGWWGAIAWGFFIGGIARLVCGARHRWVGIASFPVLCVAGEFTIGQVSEQFYFSQVFGGFVFLAFVAVLCIRFGNLSRVERSSRVERTFVSPLMKLTQDQALRVFSGLLIAGLPAIYPLSLFSAISVVGALWIAGSIASFTNRYRPEQHEFPRQNELYRIQPRRRRGAQWLTHFPSFEASWLALATVVGFLLWLPSGLSTSNTMISQEGGLAELSLRSFGGPVALVLGLLGLVSVGLDLRRSRGDRSESVSTSGSVVLVGFLAIAGQIGVFSLGQTLGFAVTRYYVLKPLYLGVPLALILVLTGVAFLVQVGQDGWPKQTDTSLGGTAANVSRTLRGLSRKVLVGGVIVSLLANVWVPRRFFFLERWTSSPELVPSPQPFESDFLWLAQRARNVLPNESIAVVADPATSYLVWNAVLRQKRSDDPVATFDSFAKTNRWADWPAKGDERYLLTSASLAERYLQGEGVRIAGIRGSAILLSAVAEGRVRRVTKGELVLPIRTDPVVTLTKAMRRVVSKSGSVAASQMSTSAIRKAIGYAKADVANSEGPLVEDEFRLAAMGRSAEVSLGPILFAESLRLGHHDDRVTAAITELVAVTKTGEAAAPNSDTGAIDPTELFGFAAVSSDSRLVIWRSEYLSLAFDADRRPGGTRARLWADEVANTSEGAVFHDDDHRNDQAMLQSAALCGALGSDRRTLALRTLSATLARRPDLQAMFGQPESPKLRELIDWVDGVSDSDAAKLLRFWPELEAIASACDFANR